MKGRHRAPGAYELLGELREADREYRKAQKLTSFGGSTDQAVKAITRAYDDLGRLTKVTSHGNATSDPTDTTDVENQVVREHDGLGQLTTSYQAHGGVKGASTPSVQYGYDETADANGQLTPAMSERSTEHPDQFAASRKRPLRRAALEVLTLLFLAALPAGAGADGSDRVTLVWEAGQVRNTQLRVHVKANERTGWRKTASSTSSTRRGTPTGTAG